MNRIFHARIAWYQYFLVGILSVNAFGFLWFKYAVPAVFIMLLLIVVIEQAIHTTYTITSDDKLILSFGRFIRKKVIPVREIVSITKCHSMKFGKFSVTEYLLIEYGQAKFVTVIPVKEREFVEWIDKRKNEEIENNQPNQ